MSAKKKNWIIPKIERLNHNSIMGKENFPVPEQGKTNTDTTAVQAVTS